MINKVKELFKNCVQIKEIMRDEIKRNLLMYLSKNKETIHYYNEEETPLLWVKTKEYLVRTLVVLSFYEENKSIILNGILVGDESETQINLDDVLGLEEIELLRDIS